MYSYTPTPCPPHPCQASGVVAFKLYPAGATTNSAAGVKDLASVLSTLREMARLGMVLCVHGEVVDPTIDIFDREKTFITSQLIPLLDQVPDLRVVMEHITTGDAADFVARAPDQVAATVTPQHLLLNRNDLLVGGLRYVNDNDDDDNVEPNELMTLAIHEEEK